MGSQSATNAVVLSTSSRIVISDKNSCHGCLLCNKEQEKSKAQGRYWGPGSEVWGWKHYWQCWCKKNFVKINIYIQYPFSGWPCDEADGRDEHQAGGQGGGQNGKIGWQEQEDIKV